MKTLWFRVLIWYGLTFLGVSGAFVALSYWKLEGRLPSKVGVFSGSTAHFYPNRDRATGSTEIYWSRREITRLEALYAMVMLLAFCAVTVVILYRILEPIRSLNRQLEVLEPKDAGLQVTLDDASGEMRRLEENINNQLAHARLTLMHLNRYTSQVAHELRTPLTVMRLKIEQAADKIDPKLAEEIQAELLRLSMHVEQSLLVARAEQGHLQLNPIRFDLGNLLNEAIDDFRLLAQDQGRAVEFFPRKAYVTADPKYTKQILYNLLNNALRHGTGPVRVRLNARNDFASLVIGNLTKAPTADVFNLALGRRIVAALVGLHGNMVLRTRRLHGWYFVRLVVTHH
ncbi:MAG TPA: HAMP domain-containing sensor histidine kinase [Opitutaceae bacterium]|nr:HAMP domain-containing sensor histidine kinase [Opitutaceae bacterium]